MISDTIHDHDALLLYYPIQNWLVVSTPLKNMNVNGKDYPIYEMDK
jgi:hypothetical protein